MIWDNVLAAGIDIEVYIVTMKTVTIQYHSIPDINRLIALFSHYNDVTLGYTNPLRACSAIK